MTVLAKGIWSASPIFRVPLRSGEHGQGHQRVGIHHRLIGKATRLAWRIGKPRTIGVRALLLDRDGRVALVRHTYADHWYLPGGGVKKGESIADALMRELTEEVAIADAVIERVLGVYHSRGEGKDDHIVIFVVRTAASGILDRADRREIEQAGWFTLDDLPEATSPATRRRIAEYRRGATGTGAW
jgi:ADP-ribose pyrophosphatase YjhB (NUDIX family)